MANIGDDTRNLMGGYSGEPSIEKQLREQRAIRKAQIAKIKSELHYYQELSQYPAFKQYIADMTDRKSAAFEAMDKAEDPTTLAKTVGEYVGINRAINHTTERIASLTSWLQEQGSTVDTEE